MYSDSFRVGEDEVMRPIHFPGRSSFRLAMRISEDNRFDMYQSPKAIHGFVSQKSYASEVGG